MSIPSFFTPLNTVFWGSGYQSSIFIPPNLRISTAPADSKFANDQTTGGSCTLTQRNPQSWRTNDLQQINTFYYVTLTDTHILYLCSNSYGLLDPGISETEELMYVQNTGDSDRGTCKDVDLTAGGAPWKTFILPLYQTLYASRLDRTLIAPNALCPYFLWWCMDLVRLLLGWGENPQYFLSLLQDVLCQWKTSYWVIE